MIGSKVRRFGGVAAFGLIGLLLGGAVAEAQTTTGIIRGSVRDQAGGPVVGATVVARSAELGAERAAMTGENGLYSMPGLRPGRYDLTVRRIGFAPQERTAQLGIGQTMTVDFTVTEAAVALEAVVIVAAPAVETRTSEIATNINREQIQDLPSSDRNFLGLAALAPGTQLQNDRLDGTRKTFTAGAQPAEQVNVFIDGASYKNDMLQGGVVGQDASRGNPFPRNAVQEFRIITQNFKAEYQRASSAIITATTRSGGRQWEGEVFYTTINDDLLDNRLGRRLFGGRGSWIALDTFQRRDRAADPTGFRRPDFKRHQFGLGGGGPLGDRFRFFGSFEMNDQQRISRVNIVPPEGFAALDTINFAQYNGAFGQPFRSNLYFGKLTFDQSPTSLFELSYSGRSENDLRDFGGLTAFTAATRFNNDVHTGILKHTRVLGSMVNEAFVSLQYYNYNPTPNEPGPINRFFGFGCCAQIGANLSTQDFKQRRISVRDDLTWTAWQWLGSHIVKGGINVDFVNYDIVKRNAETPRFVYEPWFNEFAIPQRVEFQAGDPNFGGNNTQIGLYIQDDWSPTERLTLNVGVRWDYETAMLNNNWVTPRNVVDSLVKYQDRLFIPLDQSRYFTDGNDRSPFLGAIQPRLGASYALGREGRTVMFGGWGIYYDRNIYDISIEEQFAMQHPSYRVNFVAPGETPGPGELEFQTRYLTEGRSALLADLAGINALNPEIKLIPNDLEPPMSHQFTLGVRQLLGSFAVEAAYNGVRSRNIPTFYFANMNFTCEPRTFACFQENNIPGFGTVLMLHAAGRTWYDALALKIDRPYRGGARFDWGAGVAYTFAERHTAGYNDLFSFPNPADYPKQRRNDERHRLVGHWIMDVPFLWGMQFGGLVTLGSGVRYDLGDRFGGNFDPGGGQPDRDSFILPDAFAFRNVDLRLRKNFVQIGGNEAAITVDAFNVFNFQNLGCYPNIANTEDPNFGRAGCVVSDARHAQLGVDFRFGRNRVR